MPERQTNLRLDSRQEHVWIEHFVTDDEGNEFEETERITMDLTGNIAIDALSFYNELMRIIPPATIEDLKLDLELLEKPQKQPENQRTLKTKV